MLAMDKTMRRFDQDGRLHLDSNPISKANVCEYYGREIPGADAMGLDQDRLYKLYRDPDELAKAAPTFNNIPILKTHKPVNADEPSPELVVGSTGTDGEFVAPFLRNSMVVWDGSAIEFIDSGEQRELSAAYWYTADMTPGTSPDGERYDGVMRNLRGNHVALVSQGRAGPDVLVQDENPEGASLITLYEEIDMANTAVTLSNKGRLARGALAHYLKPMLAQDAKVDLVSVLMGTTAANYQAAKPTIIAKLAKATKGKLAQDAKLDDVKLVLDSMDDEGTEAEDAEIDDDDDKTKVKKAAEDEDDDDDDKKKDDKKDPGMDRAAMDAAITAATKAAESRLTARLTGARNAEREVRAWVGDLPMAHDSAEGVFRAALDVLSVDVKDVPDAALRHILLAQPKPGETRQAQKMAADASPTADFFTRHPGANRLLVA